MVPVLAQEVRTNKVLNVGGVELQISAVADLDARVAAIDLVSLQPNQPITPEVKVKVIELLGYNQDGFHIIMNYHTK